MIAYADDPAQAAAEMQTVLDGLMDGLAAASS